MAAHDQEAYLLAWIGHNSGGFSSIAGGGGATWSNLNYNNQSNVSQINWDDVGAGHLATDLPEAHLTWSGTPIPADCAIFAVGDGSATPFIRQRCGNDGNGDNPSAHVTYFPGPSVGDALVYLVATEGTIDAYPNADYELIASGVTSTGVSWAAFMRYPSTGSGSPDDRFDFSVPLIGTNIHWLLWGWAIGDPGAFAPYLVDSGAFTDVGSLQSFVSTAHGEAAPPDPVLLEGDGELLMDGLGEFDLGSGLHLDGSGDLLLGGEGLLEQEGGDQEFAGSAEVMLDASGQLRTVGLPPPIYEPAKVLGCGVYEVLAFTRGGAEILGQLEFDQVTWGRELDATSRATLTINGQSNVGALERCCALLGELNPFEHELGIYRDVPGTQVKRRVWSGPITKMRFPSEACIIEAFDLSGWLTVRTLHANHNYVGVDLINMWVGWVNDAMSVDNSAGLLPVVVALSGILGDRLTQITEHSYAADAIAEIATTGIDWTVIDRVLRAGPVLPQPAGPVGSGGLRPLLVDESFRIAPEIIVDGLDGANCWYVNGGSSGAALIFGEYGPQFLATPDHVAQAAAPDYATIEDQYGRIERTVSETRILDQASIDQAARTRYDLGKRLMPFITGGTLVETAPLPIEQIIPGLLCDVQLSRACKPISATMRMRSLSVSANSDGSEDVDLGLEPIGTVA